MNESSDLPPPLSRAGKRISRAFKSGRSLVDVATEPVMLIAEVMYIRILQLPASSRWTMDIRFDTTADRTVCTVKITERIKICCSSGGSEALLNFFKRDILWKSSGLVQLFSCEQCHALRKRQTPSSRFEIICSL